MSTLISLDPYRKFMAGVKQMKAIASSAASEEVRFRMVFAVANEIKSIYHVEYYDPDTTYDEDLWAATRAYEEAAVNIGRALGISDDVLRDEYGFDLPPPGNAPALGRLTDDDEFTTNLNR